MPGHEVFRYSSMSCRLSFSGGELKVRESDTLSGIAVRALEGGRLGFGHCQSESALEDALAQARGLSAFSAPSGFSFAPASKFATPDIFDPEADVSDAASLRAMVDSAREAAAEKGGKPRVLASAESASVSIENSEGFSGSYQRTAYSLYVECMHDDGYGFSYSASHRMMADAGAAGRRAAEMAIALQKAGKPESGAYTVVMEPEALESLVETLIPSLSGDWKRRGISALASGGRRLSEKLTVCDDGLSAGMNARPFDDEGTPSACRTLIDRGEVKGFLYDRETAAQEGGGAASTGACMRDSYDSAPAIGASNIVISPGDWRDLGELERYIEVRSAHGSHTANLTTGDIGLEVSAAFLVEKGKRRPLKGFMLSGNVFDMFGDIVAVEKEQKVFGSLVAPRIAFGNVRVVS